MVTHIGFHRQRIKNAFAVNSYNGFCGCHCLIEDFKKGPQLIVNRKGCGPWEDITELLGSILVD